eukprot:scaffold119126_cov31-Tisochrysis_lutea.AAC.3
MQSRPQYFPARVEAPAAPYSSQRSRMRWAPAALSAHAWQWAAFARVSALSCPLGAHVQLDRQ